MIMTFAVGGDETKLTDASELWLAVEFDGVCTLENGYNCIHV